MIKDIRNHFASKFEERIRQEAELQARRLSDNEERQERERQEQRPRCRILVEGRWKGWQGCHPPEA